MKIYMVSLFHRATIITSVSPYVSTANRESQQQRVLRPEARYLAVGWISRCRCHITPAGDMASGDRHGLRAP